MNEIANVIPMRDQKWGKWHKIKEITLPNGVKLKYAYDEDANLISYTDALGHITKYNYDENHRMISWIDAEGNKIVENTYDDQDRVVKQIDENGKTSTLSYTDNTTKTIDGDGHATVYTYDKKRRTTILYAKFGIAEVFSVL